jgi:hypothetical protein
MGSLSYAPPDAWSYPFGEQKYLHATSGTLFLLDILRWSRRTQRVQWLDWFQSSYCSAKISISALLADELSHIRSRLVIESVTLSPDSNSIRFVVMRGWVL